MCADPRRARRRRRTLAGSLAILALCAACAVPSWSALFRTTAAVEAGKPVQVEIPVGMSTADIADRLAEAGVVRNALMFRVRARLADADGDLRAGVYDLRTGMPYEVVIDTLVDGPPIMYMTVTIPEGFTLEQISERLEAQAAIPADEFLGLAKTGADGFDRDYLADAGGSLEGYLFPKTYRIREGSTARDAISIMLDQFEEEIASLDLTHAEARGMDLHDVVTIASMVEKEAKLGEERALISSVVHNRLARGMRLEVDATIEYVLPGHRFRLRNSDLRTDSPYNTYMYKGLPPGPIASPGIAALRAAAEPASTGYLYYVLTGKDGSHTFTATLEEFEEAKRKSKEVFGR